MARSAGVVGAATLASRVLGLARDIAIGNLFAAWATDAFFVAFMIPNLFRRLVGEGSLTISFVPIFTESWARDRADARRVFDATWTLGAVAGLVIALLGLVFADSLISVFAPGFAATAEKHDLAVTLLRWCFPYIVFMTLCAIAMGALNSLGHFFTPAISPVLLNVCLISAAALGALVLDEPILALGFGVVIAGVLQVAIQIPPLLRRGLSPRPAFAPGNPAVRRLGRLMLPAALGASVYQLNLLVSRFLASFQGDGAVSYLYYANRLIEFPLGVFVFALGMVGLARFSQLVGSGDRDALASSFSSTLGLTLALALPSAAGLILLREPIFAQLFAWNPSVFGSAAVEACAWALLLYALGLVPIAIARIYVNLCVAHQNTTTGARAAVVSLLVNLLASLALIGPMAEDSLPASWLAWQHRLVIADMGYAGLALASSIAALANMLYVIASARRRHGSLLSGARVAGDWTRIVVATVIMSAVVFAMLNSSPVDASKASLSGVAFLATSVAVGAVAYLISLRLLGASEFTALRAIVRRG